MEPSPFYTSSSDEDPPRPDGSWLRTAIGALLVLIGVEIILERITDREFHLVIPALGLVLLAAWFRHDRFPFLVAGSLLLGGGLGILVEGILGSAFGFVGWLGLAWGFWLIQQLSGKRPGWARVGSMITLTAGLIELAVTVGVGSALGATFGGAAAPLALMTVGLLLVFRRRLSPPVFVLGVILAASLGITAMGNVVTGSITGISDSFGPSRTVNVNVPELRDRTLVVEGRSGDVTIRTGRTGERLSVKAVVRGDRDRPIDVNQSDDEVTLQPSQDGVSWLWGGVEYAIVVPVDTNLRVVARSGDIDAVVQGGNVTIETRSGNVDVAITGDPDVDVTTRGGDIEAAGFADEDIEVEDSWNYEGDDDVLVSITTRSGDVELERRDKVPA